MGDITRAKDALFHLDAGCPRETWLRAAMATKAAGLDFEDFHAWSKAAENYQGEADCRAVWNSITEDGPVSAATLFHMARAEGWQDPEKGIHAANGHGAGIPLGPPRQAPVRPPQCAASPNPAEIWACCQPAPPTHAYLMRKQGSAEGLRIYPPTASPLSIAHKNVAGWLVVPVHDLKGNLQTLVFISDQGDKLNLRGWNFGNGCFVVGDIAESRRVFIVEGIGQAWAAWQATGDAAIVSFGAGRMGTVAAAVRDKYPAARLVLVPDRGKETQAETIARAVNGEWVELPAEMEQNADINDFAQREGAEALADLLDSAMVPPKPEPRYKLLSGADIRALPPLRWRIHGVLPAEGLAGLYGPSASGKSFLGFDMAAAIAEGRDWFGCRVEAVPVVYVCLEGEAGFRQRVAAWEAHHGRMLPDDLSMVLQPFRLTAPQDVMDLAAVVPAGAVLFIDTLNRAAPGIDENSSRDMGEILEAAKTLQRIAGGLVVMVHHVGKDSSRGLRGHSSLFAALDAAIEVFRDGDCRGWRMAKSKDGVDGEAHPFRLREETLGQDEHGEPIKSCVVLPDTAALDVKRARLPQGGHQKIAMDVLAEPLRNSREFGKDGAPPTHPCLRLEEAIGIVAPRLPVDAKHRKERTRDAIQGLIVKEIYGFKDGWLWRT